MKFNALNYFIFLLLIFSSNWLDAQTLEGSFVSKFKRYSKMEPFTGNKIDVWEQTAWKGERINKQFFLWSNEAVNNVDISVGIDSLQGLSHDSGVTIPLHSISIFNGVYILGDKKSKSCGGYPEHDQKEWILDGLDSIYDSSIEANDPKKMWISIDIPAGIPEGIYQGNIRVSSGAGGVILAIRINVINKTLPPVAEWNFHLDLWQYPYQLLKLHNDANPNQPITIWSNAHFNLIRPFYAYLANMGQKAITAHIKQDALGGPSMIKWTQHSDGSWSYDYTNFEKYVNFMSQLGIKKQINCFSLIGWNEDVIPYFDESSETAKELSAPISSEIYNERWNHFLSDFEVFLKAKGWFSKAVLFMDEISDEKTREVVNLIQSNDPEWKIGLTHVKTISNELKSNIYDLSGGLVVGESEDNPNNIRTFYTSCSEIRPNNYVTTEANPAEMTWMGWYAAQNGFEGYLRWAFDFWKSSNPFDETYGGNTAGDFSMVYRASNSNPNRLIRSFRSEMLREGIQDFEKIKILTHDLSESSNPFDRQRLDLLRNWMEQFNKNSGYGAEYLVSEGQKILNQVANSDYGYCDALSSSTSSTNNYFTSYIRSEEGKQNISYYTSSYPAKGYAWYSNAPIKVNQNPNPDNSFKLYIENSANSNCANTYVWVDWNQDYIFSDNEQVFAMNQNDCNNPTIYSIDINVPNNIKAGLRRIRVRLLDKGTTASSCGEIIKSSVVDLNLEVLDNYCTSKTDYNTSSYFIEKLQTNGCDENIIYDSTISPRKGYTYHQDTYLRANMSNSFKLDLSLSESSKCARPTIWIDWNQDDDFLDSGEHIFTGGISASCLNSYRYGISITVPSSALEGTTRMRVMVKDAWFDPAPCDTDQSFSTVDFDLKIGSAGSSIKCLPALIHPLSNSKLDDTQLFTWNANGNSVDAFKLTISSVPYAQSIPEIHYQQTFSDSTSSTVISSVLPNDGRKLQVELNAINYMKGNQVTSLSVYAPDKYCTSEGGLNENYFAKKIVTQNGYANIDYQIDEYPENGYAHHINTRVIAIKGDTLSFSIKNSGASNCAVSKLYIDWNNDAIFDSNTELVTQIGNKESCKNPIESTFEVVIPNNAYIGLTRMRYIVRDAWTEIISCDKVENSATTDFDIQIQKDITWYPSLSCSGSTTDITGIGTILGTEGSRGNNMTRNKVFDGDNNTFFDAPTSTNGNGAWVGLDLGSNKQISCIKFRPREVYEDRMRGGKFQISSDASFSNPRDLFTISTGTNLSLQDYYLTDDTNPDGVSARYVRYLSPDGGWGNIAEMEVYEIGEENIALNKPAEQSSSFPYAHAGLAVDGLDAIDEFSHTMLDENAWWRVDFGARYGLSKVRVRGRRNCCPERLQDVKVWVGDTHSSNIDDYTFIGTLQGNSQWQEFDSLVNKTGRYLLIRRSDSNPVYLTLNEVEAFGEEAQPIPVTSVSVSPTSAILTQGKSLQLTATVLPVEATNQDVVWSSGDTSIATVDQNGRVTAVSEGDVIITLTSEDGEFTATTDFDIQVNIALNKPAEQSSSFPYAHASLAVDGLDAIDQFSHTMLDENAWWRVDFGARYDLSKVRVRGRRNCCPERLQEVKVWVGDTHSSNIDDYTFIGTLQGNYQWQEFDNLVNKTGRYLLIRRSDSNPVYLTLNEVEAFGEEAQPIPVTSVSVSPTSAILTQGESLQLTATVLPVEATNQDVVWSSGDTSVAIVDQNGRVTAVSEGDVIITITSEDGGFTATTDIQVQEDITWYPSLSCSGSTTDITGIGTILGTVGSWGNNMTKDKVFDGDNNTFFDAPTSTNGNGAWVGLDLGSNKQISCIKFRARQGYEDRMRGGKFQISSDASFTNPRDLFTISTGANLSFQDYYLTDDTDPDGVSARYVRYLSPDGGWGNIAEMEVYENQIPVTSVSVSPTSAILTQEGESLQLTATVSPVDATNQNIVWSSSDTSIATVDQNGLVTAVSRSGGRAIITVTSEDTGFTATSEITAFSITVDSSAKNNPKTKESTKDITAVDSTITEDKNNSIDVYPNPSGGEYTIRLKGVKKSMIYWKVFDINTRLVTQGNELLRNTTSPQEVKISIPSYYPNGVFILEIKLDNHSIYRYKLLKM